MTTIELTEDEALSLRNDVAVHACRDLCRDTCRQELGKGHTENPILGSVQKSNRYKGRIVFDYAY